jgi:transposase
MVHVHGPQVQQLVAQTRGVPPEQLLAVPVDVGKTAAAALVCDFTGEVLARQFPFALTRPGVVELVRRVEAVQAGRPVELVRVGIEAAGHYHRPLTSAGVLPADWQVVELNPAHVTAQRRTNGQRGVKTDAVDLAAICDLLLAGRGLPVSQPDAVLVELAGLVAHRARRVQVRSALKNQLLGQVDRCFPGLAGCLADLLGTKVGRLVVSEFADPARLAQLGAARFRAFAARRGVLVAVKVAERLVAAARVALPTDQAVVARRVLADDLALLASLDGQIGEVEQQLGGLLPATPSPSWRACPAGPGYGSRPTPPL